LTVLERLRSENVAVIVRAGRCALHSRTVTGGTSTGAAVHGAEHTGDDAWTHERRGIQAKQRRKGVACNRHGSAVSRFHFRVQPIKTPMRRAARLALTLAAAAAAWVAVVLALVDLPFLRDERIMAVVWAVSAHARVSCCPLLQRS
jgi:hypothetical protein